MSQVQSADSIVSDLASESLKISSKDKALVFLCYYKLIVKCVALPINFKRIVSAHIKADTVLP